SGGLRSRSIWYSKPAQPPPFTERRIAVSGGRPFSWRMWRNSLTARSVTEMAAASLDALVGVSVGARVLMGGPGGGRDGAGRGCGSGLVDAVRARGLLGPVVGEGGADRVLGEDRTVDLHRRQRQLVHDVRVLDLQGLVHGLALHPLRRQAAGRDRRAAA